MNTIYIDVLLAVNFYVNYFLILGTSKITHLPLSVRRGILSALAGSLFSLLILLPPLMPILTLAIRCISAVVMVFIAFPFKSFRYFLSSVCCFFLHKHVICWIYACNADKYEIRFYIL